jgi:signal transduction histidine kinase
MSLAPRPRPEPPDGATPAPEAGPRLTALVGGRLEPAAAQAALTQAFELFQSTTLRLQESYDHLVGQYGAVMEERDLLRREVERTQTLAALGEMAATVAHEIRNPLGGIAGYATLLLKDLEAVDPRRRHVMSIVDGAERLEGLVTGLLLLARDEPPARETGSLNELLEDLCLYASEEIHRGGPPITVRFHPAPGRTPVRMDRRRLPLLFQNLFRNAVAHQPAGGELVVSVRERTARAPFLPDVARPRFEVTVDDRGAGVPEARHEEIFRPFMTTRPDGTGLGLAIARKVARSHGGDVICRNRPRGGARFVVALPRWSDR